MATSLDCLELCRLCLAKEQVEVPIFKDGTDMQQIFYKIQLCLPVKVERQDKLPKKICNECVCKLETCYDFWNTTANSEKQLLQWLENNVEDKQTFVEVLNTNVMKQEQSSDNRLEGNFIQVGGQNSIDMTMIDNMSIITMPAGSEQQFTTVPMDTNGTVQTVQVVSGPSTQTSYDQNQIVEELEESEDDDMDDGNDNEGLPVKEETEEDQSEQQTTYINVPVSCDEAGPSGLQQQNISELTEMTLHQAVEEAGDPKSGEESFGGLSGMLRQILSPTSENDELHFCNVQQLHPHQSAALFNTSHSGALGSGLQIMPPPASPLDQHFITIQDQHQQQQPRYNDQVQILTETHTCPHCGTKLSCNLGVVPIDVGETQLVRFTCQACTRTFLAQSHMKEQQPIQQEHPHQHQQLSHISPRMHQQHQLVTGLGQQQVQYQQNSSQVMSQHHQTTTSGASVGSEKNFSCDKCQASFRYRTLLEKHKKMHEMAAGQDKPFSCPRCLMRFETRNLYNHHAKTHKPPATQLEKSTACSSGNSKDANIGVFYNKANNTYSCETCAKEFPTVESLTSHKAVHRSRPLICDVCGKGFTHRKYYVVHQRIHTGERPYLCAMCGKSFTQASTLTVHRRYHTGERPYTCTLCGKGFVTRTIMLNHMKKH